MQNTKNEANAEHQERGGFRTPVTGGCRTSIPEVFVTFADDVVFRVFDPAQSIRTHYVISNDKNNI